MVYDYLIVGAGLVGCTFAERISNVLNKTVLIIDKRDHIGGNCYDYLDNHGIQIHKYGPHWFHTNSDKVFKYLSKFTDWRFHDHIVKTYVKGKLLPFPINRQTINELFGMDLRTDEETTLFYDSIRRKEILCP